MTLRELRSKAKQGLKGNWGLGIGVIWMVGILPLIPMFTITPLFGPIEYGLDQLVRIFFAAPLYVGLKWIYLGFIDGDNEEIGRVFDPFRKYWRIVGVTFLTGLFVTLWSLAPVIPAVIIGVLIIVLAAGIESVLLMIIGILVLIIPSLFFSFWATARYSQATFLLKNDPNLDVMAAIGKSKELMKGNIWTYFKIELFFWVWYLPFIIFAGIALFASIALLVPYIEMIATGFDNPLMWERLFINLIDEGAFLGLAFLGLILSGLYAFGISFYVSPYRYATLAAFHRSLSPRVVIRDVNDVANLEAEDAFEFFSNAPRPAPVDTRDGLSDFSEYGLRDADFD